MLAKLRLYTHTIPAQIIRDTQQHTCEKNLGHFGYYPFLNSKFSVRAVESFQKTGIGRNCRLNKKNNLGQKGMLRTYNKPSGGSNAGIKQKSHQLFFLPLQHLSELLKPNSHDFKSHLSIVLSNSFASSLVMLHHRGVREKGPPTNKLSELHTYFRLYVVTPHKRPTGHRLQLNLNLQPKSV